MKTGFKNKLETVDLKAVKNPWSFDQPEYDQRSSCYVNAGTHHGVGKVQPVGTKVNSGAGGVPKGKVDTMKTYGINYERTEIK